MDINIINSTLSTLVLLCVATMIFFVFKKSKIPYAVVLLFAGVGMAILAEHFQLFSFLKDFNLSPELIFYIFLPTLIFESAFHINFRSFKKSSTIILWLSTLGIVLNMIIVAALCHWLIGLPWIYALLFGALISPTDPVSVLATFKKIGAPPKLATIIEGESLINDGMALVLFEIMLEIAKSGGFGGMGISEILREFGMNVSGGIALGIFFGFLFSKSLDYVKESKEIEISITLILAHFTFIVADYIFGVSGILATVTAGIIIGNYGEYKISPTVKDIMVHFWDYMSFFANSLLFLIIGITLWNLGDVQNISLSILIVTGIVLFARAAVIYLLVPAINFLSKGEKIPAKWMHILHWGGLRGALVIALVLTIPSETPFYNEMVIFSTSIVFITMVLNGMTIEPFLQKLGLKNFTKLETFAYDENKLMINNKIRMKLDFMLENGFISKDIFMRVRDFFDRDSRKCKSHLDNLVKKNKKELCKPEIYKILQRHLLGVEKKVFIKLYSHGEITENLLNILLENLNSQNAKELKEKTSIGQLTWLDLNGGTALFLKKIGLEKIVIRAEKKMIMLRYEMYRSRVIAIDQVLEVLKEMEESHIFYDESAIDYFKKKYLKWRCKAVDKMMLLENSFSEYCNEVKLFLAKRAAYHVEDTVLKSFKDSGIISDKLYQRFLEERDIRYRERI